jgi:type IV secretion system protein VirB10
MINPDESPKPVNLEGEREENQEEVLAAAEPDKVVRGVNGSLTPKVRKLRPLAGIILIALVVLAAAYMRHGLANRHKKTVKQTDTQKVGAGPATTVEKGLLSDQARSGLNTGQTHFPDSSALRSSILTGETPAGRSAQPGTPGSSAKTTSIPPLEYRQTPVTTAANGSLSYAEQRRLDEYNREREAMEAPTSVKGNLPGTSKETASTSSDPLGAIQSALLNARTMLGGGTGSSPQSALAQAGTTGAAEQRSDYDRQNDQEQRTAFGQQHSKQETEYLTATRQPAQGQYEVKAGWLIPAVLEQQLNSDLPGMIRALVRENVYDSATGRYILIPSGSTLIGVYNSHVGYGQNALQAVWRRIVFPDGSSLALGGFEGDDSSGAAGFRDQVNNHWGQLLSGALLTSVFAAGIEVSQGTNSSVLQSQSVGQTVGQAVGQQVGQLGTEVTRRNLNIQPTVVVRPGYRFFVRVEKDILFSGPYGPLTAMSIGGTGRSVSSSSEARVTKAVKRGPGGSQQDSQKEINSQGEP